MGGVVYSGWCFGYGNTSLYLVFKEKLSRTVAKAAVKELRLSQALGVVPKGAFAEVCF